MLFHEVIGQQNAAQKIRQAIDDGKMPHALMISGREGSGALSLALATTQYILCENHRILCTLQHWIHLSSVWRQPQLWHQHHFFHRRTGKIPAIVQHWFDT